MLLCVLFYVPGWATEVDLKGLDVRSYNSLSMSHDADKVLKENGNLPQFLEEALPIAQRYGLENEIGFRLAHKHHDLDESKGMVERFQRIKGIPAFVTTIEEMGEGSEAVPASWIYSSHGLKVFEYSADPNVANIVEKLSNLPGFWKELERLTKRLGLLEIVAPAVLNKENFKYFNTGQPLFEKIRMQPYASILVNKSIEEINEIRGFLVQTTWALPNTRPDVLCVTHCGYSEDEYRWHEVWHS